MEIKRTLPSISLVVARSWPQKFIGYQNKLLWHLKSDLRFFKNTTSDHAIIMGRRTYESIGRPLPNRMNIVLSRQEGNDASNLRWVNSRESALFVADVFSILNGKKEIFVIGGAEIYELFKDLFNKIFLTEVFASFPNGDALFNIDPDHRRWKTIDETECPKSEDDEFPFRITIMERRRKTVRQKELHEFLVDGDQRRLWVAEHALEDRWHSYDRVPDEQFRLAELLKG